METENSRHIAIPAERKKRMLSYIEEHGSAPIRELAWAFGVSEATVRRDLAELDDEGCIERTHGGAMLPHNSSVDQRGADPSEQCLEEKKVIAAYIAGLVQDGETVFLDAGSTSYQVGKALGGHRNLTVLTHDLHIASTIILHPTSTLVVTGGVRREKLHTLTGVHAEQFVRSVRVDKAVLGAGAVDLDYGVSDMDLLQAGMKRLIVEAARWVALAADHTKFGRTLLAKVCSLDDIDVVVSDRRLELAMVSRMEQRGVAYYLA